MPYYCTVPRCTSMAGKAKNVSFHQFPRDEELAEHWNNILQRGKPYTKYSKVCSLHFTPEDYTITSVGKNKGQWRTLRKDAVPSKNLPSDGPSSKAGSSPRQHRASAVTTPTNVPPNFADPLIAQQIAQAIYVQTMLAIQAANCSDAPATTVDAGDSADNSKDDADDITANGDKEVNLNGLSQPSSRMYSDLEDFVLNYNATRVNFPMQSVTDKTLDSSSKDSEDTVKTDGSSTSYKCRECTKCFKDPDVFTIHKRSHKDNADDKEEISKYLTEKSSAVTILEANPILAKLLTQSNSDVQIANSNSQTLNVEKQIITAMAMNMQAYLRNLSLLLTTNTALIRNSDVPNDDLNDSDDDLNDSSDSNALVINES